MNAREVYELFIFIIWCLSFLGSLILLTYQFIVKKIHDTMRIISHFIGTLCLVISLYGLIGSVIPHLTNNGYFVSNIQNYDTETGIVIFSFSSIIGVLLNLKSRGWI